MGRGVDSRDKISIVVAENSTGQIAPRLSARSTAGVTCVVRWGNSDKLKRPLPHGRGVVRRTLPPPAGVDL